MENKEMDEDVFEITKETSFTGEGLRLKVRYCHDGKTAASELYDWMEPLCRPWWFPMVMRMAGRSRRQDRKEGGRPRYEDR